LPLHSHLLGYLSSLQVHHLFPKAVLYEAGYHRSQVNAVANFSFLTQDANLKIGKRRPADYFAEAESRHPGVLASQWIPQDPALWQIDRYLDFLAARRELLAKAANSFLGGLRSGGLPAPAESLERLPAAADVPDGRDELTDEVTVLVNELTERGCAEPALDSEIADPADGRALAVADACWPEGLQTGQGNPVVLVLDTEKVKLDRLRELGYEIFTSIDSLRGFVLRRNKEAAGPIEESGPLAEPQSTPAAETSSRAGEDVQPSTDGVVREFERAMRDIATRSKTEAHYNPTLFISMISEHGGLGTAKRLLASAEVSSGFTALWERGHLDLTVEALVTDPRFASLFSETEVETANERLDQLGYQRPTF
jgi:hypothetical protein